MFERKRTPIERLALPAAALLLAGAAAWWASLPPLRIAAAEAGPAAARVRHVFVGAERLGGIPLEQLRNAQHRLDSAAVRDRRGEPVGFVHDVVVGKGGQPEFVRVAFGGMLGIGARIVPLKADTLGYDSTHNIVLTELSETQLARLAQRREQRTD